MGIPFSTTLISVVRDTAATQLSDGYDPVSALPSPSTEVVVTGVRAVVTAPTGTARLVGGERVVHSTQMTCDPCDLQEGDIVSEASGTMWVVLSADPFGAFSISGVRAALRRTEGFSP